MVPPFRQLLCTDLSRLTYSSIFAVQNLNASNLAMYWGVSHIWQIIFFYFVTPGVLVLINLFGVNVFGWIEAISGILKICLVVGITIVLYVMAAASKPCPGKTKSSFVVLTMAREQLVWKWS